MKQEERQPPVSPRSAAGARPLRIFHVQPTGVAELSELPEAPPASAAEAGTVPEGGRVMLNGAHCTSGGVAVAEQIMPAPEAARAPRLTDVQTAASARTPYAVIARDIAVVAPANAEQVWQRAPLMATALVFSRLLSAAAAC